MSYLGSGPTRFNTADDLTVTDDAEIGGDLTVTGSADINGGTIDGVTIGGASAGAVTATTITGSGDMNIDSGTLFVDASEGEVGIGTTSPNQLLHLSANPPVMAIGSTGASDPRIDFYDQGTTTITASIFLDQDQDELRIQRTASGAAVDGIKINGDGSFAFNSGFGSLGTAYGCRAWVNFDGNPITIRGDGNVSTIGDFGVGQYRVNFSSSMPDINYSAIASNDRAGANANAYYVRVHNYQTASVDITNVDSSAFQDPNICAVVVFR